MAIFVQCAECGRTFRTQPAYAKRKQSLFCSRRCFDKNLAAWRAARRPSELKPSSSISQGSPA